MPDNGVRIDELNPELLPSLDHVVAAMRDGATVQFSFQQVADLILTVIRGGAPEALDTLKELADLTDTLQTDINTRLKKDGSNIGAGAGTLLTALGFSTFVQTLLDDADAATLRSSLGLTYADLPFLAIPVGGLLSLPTHITGVAEPGTGSSLFRFAKLTAGLTGGGSYNNGILTSESVTGSAPLVVATATVSLSGSPINGQSIRLLNTEARFVRPGTSSGTVRNSQFQDHKHVNTRVLNGTSLPSNAATYDIGTTEGQGGDVRGGWTGGVRTESNVSFGTDTYPKHVEHTYYMRVK